MLVSRIFAQKKRVCLGKKLLFSNARRRGWRGWLGSRDD
jgi:hypothetical protein